MGITYVFLKQYLQKNDLQAFTLKLVALGIFGESGSGQDGVKEDLNFI